MEIDAKNVLRTVVIYKDTDGDAMQGVLFTANKPGVDAGEQQSAITRPAVIVFHAREGLTPFDERQAMRLLDHGCVAFCADVYGIENHAKTDAGWTDSVNKFKADRTGIMRRHVIAAVDYVKSLPFVDNQQIGAIGFCLGGMCVLDLARINCTGLSVVASFHGLLTPLPDQLTALDKLPKIGTTILVCHGDEDGRVSPESFHALAEELRQRGAKWHFIKHGGTKHGFSNPTCDGGKPGFGYDAEAADLSWAAMLNLFRQKNILM